MCVYTYACKRGVQLYCAVYTVASLKCCKHPPSLCTPLRDTWKFVVVERERERERERNTTHKTGAHNVGQAKMPCLSTSICQTIIQSQLYLFLPPSPSPPNSAVNWLLPIMIGNTKIDNYIVTFGLESCTCVMQCLTKLFRLHVKSSITGGPPVPVQIIFISGIPIMFPCTSEQWWENVQVTWCSLTWLLGCSQTYMYCKTDNSCNNVSQYATFAAGLTHTYWHICMLVNSITYEWICKGNFLE